MLVRNGRPPTSHSERVVLVTGGWRGLPLKHAFKHHVARRETRPTAGAVLYGTLFAAPRIASENQHQHAMILWIREMEQLLAGPLAWMARAYRSLARLARLLSSPDCALICSWVLLDRESKNNPRSLYGTLHEGNKEQPCVSA